MLAAMESRSDELDGRGNRKSLCLILWNYDHDGRARSCADDLMQAVYDSNGEAGRIDPRNLHEAIETASTDLNPRKVLTEQPQETLRSAQSGEQHCTAAEVSDQSRDACEAVLAGAGTGRVENRIAAAR